jgi:peptide/nickel transport system substrate-binding protein
MLRRSIEAPASYIPLLFPFIAVDSADSFTVVDDVTFTIKPNQPTALFNRFMTFQVFGPIQESLATAQATEEDPFAFDYFTTAANASGPYALNNWDQARGEVILDPNPGWPGSVANDGIIVRNVPDAEQRALLLQNGDIDVASGLPPRLLDQLKADSNLNIYSAPSTRINYIGMNATAEPNLANKQVRQAISYAIPYQALIDNVMFGFASPAGTLITSNMETYQGDAAGVYTTDMAKAQELMAASGVGPFEVELAVQNSRAQDQQAAVFIQDALSELGITVNINVLPDGDFSGRRDAKELAMFFHEWFSWGDDPYYQLTFLAKCGAFTNFAVGCNERLDEIIQLGTFETDPAVRNSLSLEAQQLMVDDADRIYLWSADWNLATRSDITGVTKDFTEVPRFENLARG